MKILPVTEFRGKVLKMVRNAQRSGQEYVITARGKPAAVLVGFDDWEAIVETRMIQSNKKLMQTIRKSQRYFSKGGKGKSHHELNWS
ncbi:MAG: type II toxin-antitoxin system Phd/YefM family antitoxin [Deltaproteobacteria bacterium]|nr:type II toxin-antitoxin system Phd/YefM family antitoxin [Deltaproteobacteria bacterium]